MRHPNRSARLYRTVIRHTRTTPVRHSFSYNMTYWLVDVDEPPRYRAPLKWLTSFRSKDHCGNPTSSLRDNITRYLAENDIGFTGGKILLFAQPMVLGHVFNPLSVWWCVRSDSSIAAVVAEVHNTYGQRHRYLLHPNEQGVASAEKDFTVSPFLPVKGDYRIRVPMPGDTVKISISLHGAAERPFVATVEGTQRALTTMGVIQAAHSALLTAARIRKHGVWLWLRRLPIVAKPQMSKENAR
ncbi:MAG: DUF1365 domain-containing protein [Corynebacteriales bacterium]|nr:DUF1365 domain-containing protein [Mycobacteriales bacterium]